MKKTGRCIVSATIVALLTVGIGDYALNIGKATKITTELVQEAAQSDVIVEDFIHDNYVIGEKNPWTDYDLKPIEYSQANGAESFEGKIDAGAAILVDVDSKSVIYSKNQDKKMYPASTTKLMTALTVLQVMKTSDVITVGDEVEMIAADSSKAGFAKGQVVTVQELLEGLLISSGNDAAYILAKATGKAILDNNIANEGEYFTSFQCVQRFVMEMNRNVRDMELRNTNFTTPDGYDDENQYTTSADLAKIAIEAYGNETIMKICGTKKKYSKTLEKTWYSTNELMNKEGEFYYKNCIGMKTGTTGLAGKCLVSLARSNKGTCVCVVLNEKEDSKRWSDSLKLLKFGLK